MQIGIHSYYPFGAELNLAPSEQPSELMKFTGHERDLLASNPNTLDYMHARYDMSTMGRFLSIDPVLDVKETVRAPQLWNRYVYVMNNPLRFTDPTGREHVAEPGFTKPLSEADWSDAPPVIKAAFYAEGGLLAMSALRAAGAGLNTLALNVLVRFATMGGGAAATAEGLRRAAEGGGPTTTVVTNLTRAPAEGRALSAAVGEGAQALASAARSGEGVKTFAAQIPQALIKGLEAAKLLSISTTQMNGVQATEYRFAPAAAEYIIKFFKEMK
jgi:RHS repeat-associated protein